MPPSRLRIIFIPTMTPPIPQAQRAPLLERVLTVIIGNALVLAGLCMYYYLVGIYESYGLHPTPTHLGAMNWPTSCVYHAQWAQPVPGHTDLFQSHAWFTLPAADFQTLFLLSQDRHASGVVYFAESAGGVADIEVEVEAFYESEVDDALKPEPEGTSICVLRRGQGQYGLDVLAPSARHRYEYGAQDTDSDDRDITLKITVWLPDPRSGADVAFRVTPWLESNSDLSQFQYVFGDSLPHVFGQVSFPLLNAPMELVTSITADKAQITTPDRYVRGKFNPPSSSELAASRDLISAEILLARCWEEIFSFYTRQPERWNRQSSFTKYQLSWNVDSASEDLCLCSAGEDSDSFKLLHLSVHANPDTESPAEQSQTWCVTSRVVGRGACLVRDSLEWNEHCSGSWV